MRRFAEAAKFDIMDVVRWAVQALSLRAIRSVPCSQDEYVDPCSQDEYVSPYFFQFETRFVHQDVFVSHRVLTNRF